MATIRLSAIMVGLGLGVLALAVSALVLWLALSALGVEGAAGAATTFSTLIGFAVAGGTAARRTTISVPLHGALSAVLVALVVLVTSILGGSPAPTPQVLLLAAFAIAIGTLSATLTSRLFVS